MVEMPVTRKDVVGLSVDVTLLKKVDVNHEDLLQERLSALTLQSTDKKFKTPLSLSIRDLIAEIPFIELDSKDMSVGVQEQSVRIRIPRTPPFFEQESAKEFPDSKKMAVLNADANLLFAVFLASLKSPAGKVKIETSVFLIYRHPRLKLVKALDKTLLSSLNKVLGIDSASSISVARVASAEKAGFECSIEHHTDKNRADITLEITEDSATFTTNLEERIEYAISQVNQILNLLEHEGAAKTGSQMLGGKVREQTNRSSSG